MRHKVRPKQRAGIRPVFFLIQTEAVKVKLSVACFACGGAFWGRAAAPGQIMIKLRFRGILRPRLGPLKYFPCSACGGTWG